MRSSLFCIGKSMDMPTVPSKKIHLITILFGGICPTFYARGVWVLPGSHGVVRHWTIRERCRILQEEYVAFAEDESDLGVPHIWGHARNQQISSPFTSCLAPCLRWCKAIPKIFFFYRMMHSQAASPVAWKVHRERTDCVLIAAS